LSSFCPLSPESNSEKGGSSPSTGRNWHVVDFRLSCAVSMVSLPTAPSPSPRLSFSEKKKFGSAKDFSRRPSKGQAAHTFLRLATTSFPHSQKINPAAGFPFMISFARNSVFIYPPPALVLRPDILSLWKIPLSIGDSPLATLLWLC